MITKGQAKFYQSLHHKKYRKEHGFFLVEGKKIVSDVFQYDWPCEVVLMTKEHEEFFNFNFPNHQHLFEVLEENDLKKLSQLNTSPGVIAVLKNKDTKPADSFKGFVLGLDGIKDPGNLGTIIRSAEWFGFEAIYLVNECVEWTNAKVLQASMGSFIHIPIIESDIIRISEMKNFTHYAFEMEGKNAFEVKFQKPAMLWFGSESHGLSNELKNLKPEKVTIPKSVSNSKTESLNVATAVAIGIAAAMQSK